MGDYIDGSEIEAHMGTEAFLRAFDKNRDGVADTAILESAIRLVETRANAKLKASHDTPFAPGSVPQLVKDACCLMAPHAAVMFYPGNTSMRGGSGSESRGIDSPYRGLYEEGLQILSDLAKDNQMRLPSGPPKPTSTLEGPVYGMDGDAAPGGRVVSSGDSCGARSFWQKPRFWDF